MVSLPSAPLAGSKDMSSPAFDGKVEKTTDRVNRTALHKVGVLFTNWIYYKMYDINKDTINKTANNQVFTWFQ
jgi:hypothetical protein